MLQNKLTNRLNARDKQLYAEIEETFHLFDTDNDGYVSISELKDVLKLNFDTSEMHRFIYELIEQKSTTNTKLDFNQFVDLMTNSVKEHANDDDLYHIIRIFKLFDHKNKGYLTIDDLRKIIFELNEDISEKEMEEMIVKADTNQDGVISLEEFMNIFKKKKEKNVNVKLYQ